MPAEFDDPKWIFLLQRNCTNSGRQMTQPRSSGIALSITSLKGNEKKLILRIWFRSSDRRTTTAHSEIVTKVRRVKRKKLLIPFLFEVEHSRLKRIFSTFTSWRGYCEVFFSCSSCNLKWCVHFIWIASIISANLKHNNYDILRCCQCGLYFKIL